MASSPASASRLEIRGYLSEFRFNEAEMTELLTGPAGPVAKDLTRRAIRVTAQAKLNASGRPGPNVRTGRLRGSITWRLRTGSLTGMYAEVGSAVEYAKPVEDRFPFLKPALEAARV